MITLYGYGPAFGLPDPSPFVMKAATLLRMANVEFKLVTGDPRKAPKGKLPWIDDNGVVVADSSLIRVHLERTRAMDFDAGYDAAVRGTAWAFEKLCEDQIYWAIVYDRWLDDAMFDRGPRQFFNVIPALLRPLIISMVRRQVRRDLHGQGLARHTPDQVATLACRAIDAVADFLGSKPYLLGDTPCGADASVFPIILNLLCPLFDTPARRHAESHANLVAYTVRMRERYFSG
jgi:glutathione S-transferase